MEVPGLVDLQVNGYKGVDFSSEDLTKTDFISACNEIFNSGTTAFLPTLITSPKQVYEHNLPIIASVLKQEEFSGKILGIHIEGPFISAEEGARGAHNPAWIAKPDIDYLDEMIEWSDRTIKLITIAAETKGAEEFAQYATSKGIRVSLGHQMATSEDLTKLVRAGAVALTHLGNGVPALLDRHKNPIWAGLANDKLSAIIITDGHHLPSEMLKTFFRAKGVSRCVVVSDASAISGMPPGRYKYLGEEAVIKENGKLYNPDTGYLAGSSYTMLQCMNYLASLKLLSPAELIDVGFYNPLKLIGSEPASIQSSKEIVFDEKQNVFVTF